jgi:hypothetical protein
MNLPWPHRPSAVIEAQHIKPREHRSLGLLLEGNETTTNTRSMLEPGARVWVNIPGTGYVGVARVVDPAVTVDNFMVEDDQGRRVSIKDLPIDAAKMNRESDNPETAEDLVRVEWIKTVPIKEAIKEKGFFVNQNSVARPVAAKWEHTIQRLKKRFGVT